MVTDVTHAESVPYGSAGLGADPTSEGTHAQSARLSNEPRVSSLIYRSRAKKSLDASDLAALLQTARLRNNSESITGLLLYDRGQFLQWLEGPPAALRRVADSIGRDPRHEDMEVIARADGVPRNFTGWDMRLASSSGLSPLPPGANVLPRRLLDAVKASPNACGRLLPFLLDDDSTEPDGATDLICSATTPPDQADQGDRLREAIELVVRTRLEGEFPGLARVLEQERLSGMAGDLARLVVAGRDVAAHDLLVSECSTGDPFARCAGLIEPTAEALGDLWSEDACSDIDLTVSLCQLQTEFRMLCSGWPIDWSGRGAGRSILVASVPGEADSLGPAMASEALWRAGCRVDLVYPETEEALLSAASAAPYDAVHLSLSPVFHHGERLDRMAAILHHVREASARDDLDVLVSGRAFREDPRAAIRVGADAAAPSVVGLERIMERSRRRRAG